MSDENHWFIRAMEDNAAMHRERDRMGFNDSPPVGGGGGGGGGVGNLAGWVLFLAMVGAVLGGIMGRGLGGAVVGALLLGGGLWLLSAMRGGGIVWMLGGGLAGAVIGMWMGSESERHMVNAMINWGILGVILGLVARRFRKKKNA